VKYILKQKLFCMGDDFSISDEHGREMFYVDGYAFSLGQKFSFQNMQKKELGVIRKRLFTFSPTYKIHINDSLAAIVRKKVLAFRPTVLIEIPNAEGFRVTGKLVEHEYTFERKGRVYASVTRQLFKATDTYVVDIPGDDRHILFLSSAVALDMMFHCGKSKHKR